MNGRMAFLTLFSIAITWVGCGDDHSTAPSEPPPPITRFQLCDSAAFSPGWVGLGNDRGVR